MCGVSSLQCFWARVSIERSVGTRFWVLPDISVDVTPVLTCVLFLGVILLMLKTFQHFFMEGFFGEKVY